MEYTNELLQEMYERQRYNRQYSTWMTRLAAERGLRLKGVVDKSSGEFFKLPDKMKSPADSIALFNKSQNMLNCLNIWSWDLYQNAKIMDLRSVNRCKNTRFCPNCKVLETAKYIRKLMPIYRGQLSF